MTATSYILQFAADSTAPMGSGTWRSKEWVIPKRACFAVGRVVFDMGDLDDHQALIDARRAAIKRNQARLAAGLVDGFPGGGFTFADLCIAGDVLEEVPSVPVYTGSLVLTLKLYGDDVLRHTQTVYSDQPFRLTTGYRANRWYYELIGNVDKVRRVEFASSMKELRGGQ